MKKTRFTLLLVALMRMSLLANPEAPPGLSLNFQNTEIDFVLKFFSDVSGKVFIRSDSVRGFVTVASPGNVSLNEAMEILQAVLDVKGFTMVPGPGKTIKVLSHAEAAQTSLEVGFENAGDGELADRMMTHVIPLKFVPAQDVKTQVSALVSKGGSLIADDRMNAVIVTDMASNIRRLMKMIAHLDARTPQVLIEALIMEVSLTKETKLGVEWEHALRFSESGHAFTGNLGQNFGLGSQITEGFKYSVIRADQNLSGLVQALATDQKVNILSTPHIMTLNNQPAVIRVGEEVPVLTQTRNIEGGDTIRSFDYKSVAIELQVTPRINTDRDVFLKVHPSVKKILGFNAELNAPILASREAETAVLIKDGQTMVIGGLMKDDRSMNQSKIPLLGDLPLIGALFRSRGRTKEKTELLVFITPRVILTADEGQNVTVRKESETKEPRTPHRLEAEEHFQIALDFYRGKNYAAAEEEFHHVLMLSPDRKLREKAFRYLRKLEKKSKIN